MTAVPPPAPPAVAARPRPIEGLGTATAALLAAPALLGVLFVVQDWSTYQLISNHVAGRIGEDAFWEQYTATVGSPILLVLMFPVIVACGGTWLVWLHRARTNAGILSPQQRFRYSPTFSVVGMVVPFGNLWWSRPILEDICTGSSPDAPAHDMVRLVRTWWAITVGCAVGSFFLSLPLASFRVLTYTPDGRLVGGGAEAVAGQFGFALFNTVLLVVVSVTAVLLAVIIRRVSGRQAALLFPRQS